MNNGNICLPVCSGKALQGTIPFLLKREAYSRLHCEKSMNLGKWYTEKQLKMVGISKEKLTCNCKNIIIFN